ncbi:MAG: N-acetyl-alpha-D-glucosaminyl L-malate synthase BshA [Crocinitomicaceae bacterium]|jgi:N-acetyl-alpha-D-glucosaminyl L-malate synthase BshA|nr:N-acetyl-alpha-D-glucosaminyl L-malate synthase BshA [Crocinitomicaceae bacterium]
MKIGIVLYPTFGGSGVVATELGKALAKKGHEIHFITYSQPVRLGGFTENVFYHEVSVSDYPLFDFQPYETELASKMVDVVKYEKLDLIHVHYAIPHASAAFMAKQILKTQGITIPYVTTLHGTDITLVGRDPSFEPVITFCINESDAVTAVSESLKKDTLKHFNVKNEITVVPNFIALDKKRTDSKINRGLYASPDEKIISHISNFRKVKRVEDVIRVFAETIKKVPSKLLFVGDGPERYGCEQLCRELSLCEHILFLGKIRDTSDVLAISDAFLLPSETESFGLAALEAMSMGVPVVSSNSGGIPEVNENGFSGFLSDVGDVNDMSKNLVHILTENRLDSFRDNALVQAQKFAISKVLPMYEDIYTKLVR